MALRKDQKWRNKTGAYYYSLMTKAETDRSEFLQRRIEVRDLYYKEPGIFEVVDDEPWEGAADIHVPVITEKVETAVPKTLSAMWRAHPFVNVQAPGDKIDNFGLKNIEVFAGWAFRHDIEDFYETFENFLRNMFIDGTSIAKTTWDRRFRRAIDPYIVKNSYKEGDLDALGNQIEMGRRKTDVELITEVLGFGDVSNSTINVTPQRKKEGYDVRFTEAGRIYDGFASIEQSEVIDESIIRIHRKVIEYDAPKVENVELDHLLVPYRTKNIREAKWVAHKTWYSLSEVTKKVSKGEWSMTKEELAHLATLGRNADEKSELAVQKDKMIGESGNTGTELVETPEAQAKGFDPNHILIWEFYVKDFSDKQDDPVDVIHFIVDETEMIVGTLYHDEVFPHGKRPFAVGKYIPIPGRFYGWGMADLLFGINEGIDHTMSLVHNLTELIAHPFYFYTPYAATSNDKTLKGIRPGEGIPTSDVNGVRFVEFAQQPLQILHTSFDTLLGYGDRLTFSPTVGGSTNYRNAPRTAKGTMALMGAAEEHLSTVVEQLQETGWRTIVEQVMSLYGLFVATDKWFRITGETQPRRLNPRDLRHNLQYSFSGSLTSVNRDIQRQLARERYITARTDPLYNGDPRARRNLLESFLRQFSDGTDVEKEIPSLPGEGGFSHDPMEQDDEIQAMIMGMRVEVLPIDDHKKHMADIQKFKSSDAFNSLPGTVVAMIAEHHNQHQSSMQQALAVGQQQAATGQAPTQPDQGGGDPVPQAGAPVPGLPAEGGEMSFGEGGPQV